MSGAAHASNLASVSVFAAGLNNPRNLRFGPDGDLYVAEGGAGGTHSTNGQCSQVVPPIGPYTGSNSGGRISKIDRHGDVTTVVDTLPSSQTSIGSGSLVSGVADIAFIGNTLYALLAGAGCSHGVTSLPNAIMRVNADHSTTLIANLSAFQKAHPTAVIEKDDFEPDGTWYSMVAVRGALYAVEPNHGEIDRISTGGAISRVIDISASQGHVVPTALAYHGNFYVANLNVFPQPIGSSKVWKVTPSGQIKVDTAGFDMVLGLAFDNFDQMYVLEMSAGQPVPTPGTGRVTRVHPNGAEEVVADGLMFPTGITCGPDGNLYVSSAGFGMPAGAGKVLKIDLANWKH
ncbi:ScyD/ScyE family protein [Sphingobium sp. Sx8-8]|uniref:ScyD/ScyE family protein n=1 Tax=Sphingobium sp. Sx8-8 TaxID=2933617 RepID=UPI001F59740E|nr:ScyD/ScyE family protein [Sphingobium sp. Sx8-8]